MKKSFLFLLLSFSSYNSNIYNSEKRIAPSDSPAATKYNPHYIDTDPNNSLMAFPRNVHDYAEKLNKKTDLNNYHKLLSALETLDLAEESTWDYVKHTYEKLMRDDSKLNTQKITNKQLAQSMQQIQNIDHAFLIVRGLQNNLPKNSQEAQNLFKKNAGKNPQRAFDMLQVSKYAPWEEIIHAHNDLMRANTKDSLFKNKLLIATEILDSLNHEKKLPSQLLAQRVEKEPAKIIEELELPRDAAWRDIQGKIIDLYQEYPHYKHKWNIIMASLSELNNKDKLPCQQLAKIRKNIQEHPEQGFTTYLKLPIDTNWDTIRQRIDTLSVTNPQGRCTLAILREEYMHMYMNETLPYQLLEKFKQDIQQHPHNGFNFLTLPINTNWDTIYQTIDERSHTEQQPLNKCKLAILREKYQRMHETNQLPYQQQALLENSKVPSPIDKENPLPFCQEESNTPSPVYEDENTSPLEDISPLWE